MSSSNLSESSNLKSLNQGSGTVPQNSIQSQAKSVAGSMFPQRSLMDYYFIIKERFFLAFALAILVAAGFAYYKLQETPVYSTSSTLLIEKTADQVLDIELVVDTSLRDEAALENHRNQILSKRMRDWVLKTFSDEDIKNLTEPYKDKSGEVPLADYVISENISITRGRNQLMFRIGFTHRDPEQTAFIANRYATEYIKFVLDRTNVSTEAATTFLTAQADLLREQVEEGELTLQQYRRSRNLVSLEQSQNLVLDRLKSLDVALSASKVKMITLQSRADRVNDALSNDLDLLSLPEVAGYGNITVVQSDLEKLKSKRMQLLEVYLERHPKMLEVESSIVAIELRIQENIERAIQEIQNELKTADLEVARLTENLEAAEQESLDLDELAVEYNLIRRGVDNDQRMLDQILDRLNETTISSQLANSNFRILDFAAVPFIPISPNKLKIIMMTAFIFLVILCGLPIGLEMLDNKVKTAWDIESFLDKPILGEVKTFKKSQSSMLASAVLKRTDATITENYRAILSQLSVASNVGFPKRIIVSSSLPCEGKSFVSSNLAAIFAHHDYKTLIIDVDLRKPSQHRGFGLKNESGIIKWLEKNDRKKVIDTQDLLNNKELGIECLSEHLFLLKSGGSTRKPTERIQSTHFETLMNALAGDFDVIVFDTPPVGVFPDAVFLSAFADEVLYVVKHDFVSRHKVKGVISNFSNTNTPVVGIVLNSISKGKMRSGYYSYYGYSSGGYGYDYSKYAKYYADEN